MQLLESVSALSSPGLLVWLLVAIPLAGAAILLLAGRVTDAWGHFLATAAIIAVARIVFFSHAGR